MTIFHAIILGAIQGITELLPISSSAHLLLIPNFFGWPDLGLEFGAALHLGTFLAIAIYFRQDLSRYIKGFLKSLKNKKAQSVDEKLAWYLILSSVPAAFFGLILEDLAEKAFRAPIITASTLVLGAAFLWYADHHVKLEKKLEKITFRDSLIIGASQAIALVPGFSRSGVTISFGRILGLSREGAARFSFLLSAPITFGASLFELRKIDHMGPIFLFGILSALIFGFLAIKYLLTYVQKSNYNLFVYYRIGLAILVLLVLL